ncbi:MAG: carbon starvation protein A [bacterium]
MSAAIVIIFGVSWFIFAYLWYGKVIQKKVLKIDDSNITPSNQLNDGMDYVPTKPSILFGHHFSSIAGAGPIVGPIIAFAYFGWLPAMLWVLIGSVFMGAVHDYAALVASLRSRGESIVEITKTAVSGRASAIFAAFVWLTLVLVQAVFADLTAKTLAEDPHIVIPTVGILLIALLFGFFVYRKGMSVVAGTVICLAMLFGLILLGAEVPINIESIMGISTYHFWLLFAIIYSFIAATLPVWLLLQPRDYLSMYLLIIGLFAGLIGLVAGNPTISAPAFISFNSEGGAMFPMLFIIIACGAISGFHSLVASGTSAKQLRKESDGKFVAYGSMLTEGLLALMVIVMISSLLVWLPGGSGGSTINGYAFQDLFLKSPNIVFGYGLGLSIDSLGIPIKLGISFGILMLNAFILTTLDTSARLNRYVVTETIGKKYGGIFKNKYFSTAVSLFFAYILCLGGGYRVIWPVFGASNQLIATLALFVVTVFFLGYKSPKWYTLIPAIIMLIITETALIYNSVASYIPESQWHLAIISVVLFVLGLIVAFEVYKKLRMMRVSN